MSFAIARVITPANVRSNALLRKRCALSIMSTPAILQFGRMGVKVLCQGCYPAPCRLVTEDAGRFVRSRHRSEIHR
jgi:hypothetical protein